MSANIKDFTVQINASEQIIICTMETNHVRNISSVCDVILVIYSVDQNVDVVAISTIMYFMLMIMQS